MHDMRMRNREVQVEGTNTRTPTPTPTARRTAMPRAMARTCARARPRARACRREHPHDHATNSLHYGTGPAGASAPGHDAVAHGADRAGHPRRRTTASRAATGPGSPSAASSRSTWSPAPARARRRCWCGRSSCWPARLAVAVIEGDQQTTHDADRIRATGAPAVQINTGKGCHLDARMVGHALGRLAPARTRC